MKLLITNTCVGPGGAILEAGSELDTGKIDRKDDKIAFDLISSQRAVQVGSKDEAPARALLEETKKTAESGKKAEDTAKKK